MHFEGEWHSGDLEDVNFSPTIFTFNEKIPKSVEKARHDRANRRSFEQVINDSYIQYLFNYFHHHNFLEVLFYAFQFLFPIEIVHYFIEFSPLQKIM